MTQDLPTFDSIAACSGATGIPRNMIQAAKKAGCNGFDHGRVSLAPLLRWLFAEPEGKHGEAPIRWKDEYEKYRAKREKIRHDRENKEVVEVAQIEAWILRALKNCASIFYQKLVNEMPAAVAGLDAPQARIYAKRLYNLTMTPLRGIVDRPEMRQLLEKHESDTAEAK